MTSPLFFVDSAQLSGSTVLLSGPEGHHAADVRRLRVGEPVEVSDGQGARLRCRVASVERGRVTLDVVGRRHELPARPSLEVAQALIKQDAAERALTSMTEVGVDLVIPWTAERSVVTWSADRVERGLRRWRSTVTEAAKQSRRSWIPQITAPMDTSDLVRRVAEVDLALLLDADGDDPLGSVHVPDGATVLVVVGPEGGQTLDEASRLTAAGARSVHLGPTVLRAATAGTAAASVLLSRTLRWMDRRQADGAG